MPERTSPARAILDPSWLFLIAGLGILAATVLIPAADDLAHARWLRGRAAAIEAQRADRLARYRQYLDALDAQDPTLVLSLASGQLNQIPDDRTPLLAPSIGPPSAGTASVFPALEPPPIELPPRRRVGSILERLTTGESTRLWLLAGGTVCVLIALMPRSHGPKRAPLSL